MDIQMSGASEGQQKAVFFSEDVAVSVFSEDVTVSGFSEDVTVSVFFRCHCHCFFRCHCQ